MPDTCRTAPGRVLFNRYRRPGEQIITSQGFRQPDLTAGTSTDIRFRYL